jgi:hypothetical protein
VPLSQLSSRISVPIGIEAWPTKYIAVRLGKRFNWETDVLSFGAGLRFAMLSFDMSCDVTSLVTDIEFNPYFALTYTLPPSKPKPPSVKKAGPKPPAAGLPAEEMRPQGPPPAPAHADSAAAATHPVIEKPAQEWPQSDSLAVSPVQKADSTAAIKPAEQKPQPAPVDSGATRPPPAVPPQ